MEIFLSLKKRLIIGVDIRPDQICLLRMKRSQGQQQIELVHHAKLPSGVIIDGKVMEFNQLVAVMATLVREANIHGCAAAIGLPNRSVISQTIMLPDTLHEKEYEAEIDTHIQQYIPGITGKVCFDYLRLKKELPHQALLVVAKKELMSPYVDAVNQAGLLVKIVDVDVYAIVRAVSAFVKIKNKTIGILVCDGGYAQIILMRDLNIIFAQQIDYQNGDDSLLQNFFAEISKVIQLGFSAFHSEQIELFYLVGNAPYLQEIEEFMQKNLLILVEMIETKSFFSGSLKEKLNYSTAPSLVSMGLALRSCPLW